MNSYYGCSGENSKKPSNHVNEIPEITSPPFIDTPKIEREIKIVSREHCSDLDLPK